MNDLVPVATEKNRNSENYEDFKAVRLVSLSSFEPFSVNKWTKKHPEYNLLHSFKLSLIRTSQEKTVWTVGMELFVEGENDSMGRIEDALADQVVGSFPPEYFSEVLQCL